jgi:hypothetical protein
MTDAIDFSEFTKVLEHEYLDDFVLGGGAAVKFLVPDEATPTEQLGRALARIAASHGYVVASVDAAQTRIHMIDKLFHAIAEQVPWSDLAEERVRRFATQAFEIPERFGPDALATQIADHGGVDAAYVRTMLEKSIADEVFKDRELAREFRIAMTWACRARLSGGEDGDTTLADITAWLTGTMTTISNMKQYQIHTKINRTNARHYLESMLTWVRRAGRPGTAIIIDAGRLTVPRQPEGINYTKASRMDAYEVFRQYIDTTDDMSGAMIIVVANHAFLDTEAGSIGFGCYPALMNRVYDEVRDRNLPNPMASLVRINAGGQL